MASCLDVSDQQTESWEMWGMQWRYFAKMAQWRWKKTSIVAFGPHLGKGLFYGLIAWLLSVIKTSAMVGRLVLATWFGRRHRRENLHRYNWGPTTWRCCRCCIYL